MTDDNSAVNENARGKVYIFNTTNQRVQLHLNEGSLSSIDPAGQKAGSYAPKFTTADRDDATSTPDNKFAQKDNTLYVKIPGKQRTYGPIAIDPELYPTDIDLVLYIFGKYIVLSATNSNTLIYQSAPVSTATA
jgi:hypothetical protein